ncbi:MAG: hypothetical protein ABMA14_05765 [Hyphomonadaceae bacterium]
MKFGWMAPVAAIVLSACATAAPVPFDVAKFDSLKPGVTTKAEAIHILGEPSSRAPSVNNHTTLIYDYSGAKGDLKMVVLFDPEEKFVRYRAYGVDH